MDVIIDTNIIIQENFLRSKKFLALLDYLKKTNSRIVLPQIVREESISLYKKELSSQLEEVTKRIEKFSKLCFSPARIDLNIEVIKETNEFIGYFQKLNEDGLLYEIPYNDKFLHEIVFRMINRIKPCSQKGEEFRDVVLWLSIKKLLTREKSAAFISNNSKEFASLEKKDLHPDLRAELTKETLELKYYADLDTFIKNHTEKMDYITKEWIKRELSKEPLKIDLDKLIINYFTGNIGLMNKVEWKTESECIDAYPINVFEELDDFYVYEMTNGDIYLNLILYIIMEIEAELEKFGTKTLEIEAAGVFSAKIVNNEIKGIEIDEVGFDL